MRFASDIEQRLTPDELDVLRAAFDIVSDQLFEEIVDLTAHRLDRSSPGAVTRAFSDLYLPWRYRDQYDLALLRRLLVCLTCVAERITEPLQLLRCRGEELALRAVIEMAITEWDSIGHASDYSFEQLLDVCFTDLDHEYMFDEAFDGIDDPSTHEGSQLGIQSLQPSAWFDPLVSGLPVHPLVAS